jgi:hypothetical protein
LNADPMLTQAAVIRGDLRDQMLAGLRSMTKLWRDMPQADQQAMAEYVDRVAGEIVTRIALLTASKGAPVVLATLDRVTVDAEVRAFLTVPRETAAALIPHAKQVVAIMAPNLAQFMGERGPAQTMPDQPPLPMQAPQRADLDAIIRALEGLVGGPNERCVPETERTLALQQIALMEGRRPAMMFPVGTPELPLPKGMQRIATDRGVFHFNPEEIDPVSIVAASDKGEENLILGYGQYAKAHVLQAIRDGHKPCAVVERDPGGTEVLAVVSVGIWADEVIEALRKQAGENHTVMVEPLTRVLEDRIRWHEARKGTGGGGTHTSMNAGGAGGSFVGGAGGVPVVAGQTVMIEITGTGAGGAAVVSHRTLEPGDPLPSEPAPPRKARQRKSATTKPKPNGHDPAPPKSGTTKRTGSPFA